MLLTVDDWECDGGERPVPARTGRPIFAYDLGGGRAWSAAVAVWRTGRVECLAVAPGIPGLEAQEKRDRVATGTYRWLVQTGALSVAEGLRVHNRPPRSTGPHGPPGGALRSFCATVSGWPNCETPRASAR